MIESTEPPAAIPALQPNPATAGPQFYVDVWRTLAEHFIRHGFPGLPRHLSGDCGLQVAESLMRAANAVEFHLDAVREQAYADEDECEVGRLGEARNDAQVIVLADRSDVA